jgi:hypothetical protein
MPHIEAMLKRLSELDPGMKTLDSVHRYPCALHLVWPPGRRTTNFFHILT